MAIVKESAIGHSTQKFINGVLFKWKGLWVLRGYTNEVYNPNTEKQQQVRARFGRCAQMAKAFRAAISMGLHKIAHAHNCTDYGWFTKINWRAILATSVDDVIVNLSELKIAEGSLMGVTFGDHVDWGQTTHLEIVVPFEGNVGAPDTDATDEAYIVAYNSELNYAMVSSSALRSGRSVTLTVPNAWSGMDIHLYGFTMGRGDNTYGQVSDSQYIGHAAVQ